MCPYRFNLSVSGMLAFGLLWHRLVWPGFWRGPFWSYPLCIVASSLISGTFNLFSSFADTSVSLTLLHHPWYQRSSFCSPCGNAVHTSCQLALHRHPGSAFSKSFHPSITTISTFQIISPSLVHVAIHLARTKPTFNRWPTSVGPAERRHVQMISIQMTQDIGRCRRWHARRKSNRRPQMAPPQHLTCVKIPKRDYDFQNGASADDT